MSSHHETAKYQAEQLLRYRDSLTSVQSHVVELLHNASPPGVPQEVALKLRQLAESWGELERHVNAREQKIKQMLQILVQFEESYNDLSSWLHDKTAILTTSLPFDIVGVESHRELLISIKSTLNTKYHLIEIVREEGDTLVTLSSAADVEQIQTKLHKVKQSYTKLERDLDIALDRAVDAAKGLHDFGGQVGAIVKILDKYEKTIENLPQFG